MTARGAPHLAVSDYHMDTINAASAVARVRGMADLAILASHNDNSRALACCRRNP